MFVTEMLFILLEWTEKSASSDFQVLENTFVKPSYIKNQFLASYLVKI